MRLLQGFFKHRAQCSKGQYSTLISMVCSCVVIKIISVGTSQTSRSAAWYHKAAFQNVTGVSSLPSNKGEAAVDTQCLAPSYHARDDDLESGTLEGESAADTTGIDGWIWTDETFEEKERRMRRKAVPVIDNKIDFVYKFVDSSQGEHMDRKRYWESRLRKLDALRPDLVNCPAIDRQQNSVRRERNNQELLYALRSLQMYAPWFHHVFVVVEGPHMVPPWLNTSNDRLTIIYHADIFPEPRRMYLPTFNGHAVASVLHRIPCLSDYYVAMDDDFFFTSKVRPEDFFDINNTGNISGLKGTHAGGTIKHISSNSCHMPHHDVASNVNSAYLWDTFLSRFELKELASKVPEFRMLAHAPYVSATKMETYLFDDVFASETSQLRTHRFRSKADFHAQALVFNIARAAKELGELPSISSAGLSDLKVSFQSFKSENAAENINKIRAAASECQFIGINDDMGDEVGEDILADIVHFYNSTWPFQAPWETVSSES